MPTVVCWVSAINIEQGNSRMSLPAKLWPSLVRQTSIVPRILVHLPESEHADRLVESAVQLGRSCQARLRGLTLVDTSVLEESATTCESAIYAAFEQDRLEKGEVLRKKARVCFSQSCLAAGLDFDVHRKQGRLLDVLRVESRLHDLCVTWFPEDAGASDARRSIVRLVLGEVAPLLVLRGDRPLPERVLLIQDGTAASSRAARTYLSQSLFPEAAVRLLAIGPNEDSAKQILRDSLDFVSSRRPGAETGYAVGRTATLVPKYAYQWEADLVVLGLQRRSPLLGHLLQDAATRVLKGTRAALYSSC